MKFNDSVIGIVAIVAGGAVISGTFGFQELPGQQFGSAFFPRIIGGALIITGLIQVIFAKSSPIMTLPTWIRGSAAYRASAVVLVTVLWLAVAAHLGFLLSTSLIIFGLSIVAGGRVAIALGVAVTMSALLYAIFGIILRIPLPRGVIEALL